MKRISALPLLLLVILLLSPQTAQASPEDELLRQASEVFGLINQYRSANGIPELTQNSILMYAGQSHSDYQASIQQITHGGPGGSRPIDRAYAAGYGGGQVVFVSELIVGGPNRTPKDALTWWQNSSEHNYYLLNADYLELGIGVATDQDGWVYYTAELGQVAGGTTYAPENTEEGESAAVVAQPLVIPVVKAEPRENGALVHIVRTGQALWNISAVYEIPLETLYEINKLNAFSFIFPGDEIIIKEPDPATPTPLPATDTPTATITPSPSSTAQPSQANQADDQVQGTASTLAASGAVAQNLSSGESADASPTTSNANIRLTILIALGCITLVILATFFIGSSANIADTNEEDLGV